jgi:uncharacterized membrane protein YkvA (DUF1232 family)
MARLLRLSSAVAITHTPLNAGETSMSRPLSAKLEERIDDSTRERILSQVANDSGHSLPEPTVPLSTSKIGRFFEESVAKRLGRRHLVKLAAQRGRVASAWHELPTRMHLVANQTKLMMELIDDYRSGTYRKVPWHTLAIGAAAILYVANPADVLPDVLLGIGVLDDVAVAALAASMMQRDLKAYCKFKGYAVSDYFPGNANKVEA